MIDHIDPINRLIYLDNSTPDTEIHPIDIYREVRQLRRTDETLRPYDMFMTYKGAEKKNPDGSKRTERYGVLLGGTLIVPYDKSQSLDITGTLISDTGLEGRDCFDRSRLSLGVVVDIDYTPKQVEVITVSSGGTAELTQEEHDKLISIPTASENAEAIITTNMVYYVETDYIADTSTSPTPAEKIATKVWDSSTRTLTSGGTGGGLTTDEHDHLMELDTSNNIVPQDLKPLFDSDDVTIVGAE